MNWFGTSMRCPRCNKYLPDRCTCDVPSIEEIRMANQKIINEAFDIPIGSPTGRLSNSEPVEYVTTKLGVERRHRGVAIDTQRSAADSFHAQGVAAARLAEGITDLAAMLTAFYQRTTSPAGSNAGQFQLHFPDDARSIITRPVSGNARQRRRQVRIWKAMGFVIKQFNPSTRTSIER